MRYVASRPRTVANWMAHLMDLTMGPPDCVHGLDGVCPKLVFLVSSQANMARSRV